MRDNISIHTKSYLSIQFIQTAAFFCRKAFEIEANYEGTFSNQLNTEHKGYVISSVLLSVNFLEASINEFFSLVNDLNSNNKLEKQNLELMQSLWEKGIPRTANYRILEKYQIALVLNKKSTFSENIQPYQDCNLIIKLRNALVHYEPEWMLAYTDYTDQVFNEHKFQKMLVNKFKLNPLTGESNPFYPDKCLSHGCAEWVLKSVIKFTEAFYDSIGIDCPYSHVKSFLMTSNY